MCGTPVKRGQRFRDHRQDAGATQDQRAAKQTGTERENSPADHKTLEAITLPMLKRVMRLTCIDRAGVRRWVGSARRLLQRVGALLLPVTMIGCAIPLTAPAFRPPRLTTGHHRMVMADRTPTRRLLGFTPASTGLQDDDTTEMDGADSPKSTEETWEKSWFLDFGFRASYTRLGATKQQLDRRLELPLKADVLGIFKHPRTPMDRKSNLAFGAYTLGVGRNESEKFSWVWYVTGGTGGDVTDQQFLNLRLKIRFRYAAILAGWRGEFYPWGRPVFQPTTNWCARFRSGRPYAFTGVETGYISGRGEGRYTVGSVTLYHDKATVRDWVVGIPFGLGWRLPLSDCWSFAIQGDYTQHLYRPDEYNGWNVTAALRFRF